MRAGQGLTLGVDVNQLFDAMGGPLRSVLEGDTVPQDAVGGVVCPDTGLPSGQVASCPRWARDTGTG